jgi:hypothetical protein
MCQEAVRKLCNPSESCNVRKVARLLAQALRHFARKAFFSLCPFLGLFMETIYQASAGNVENGIERQEMQQMDVPQ